MCGTVCSYNTQLTFHAKYTHNVVQCRQAFRGVHNKFTVLNMHGHTQSFSTCIHLKYLNGGQSRPMMMRCISSSSMFGMRLHESLSIYILHIFLLIHGGKLCGSLGFI